MQMGWVKIGHFRQKTRYNSKTVQDRRIIIIIIIIKHIYRAHFRRMPQMRWRQQLHVK